jgi:hypothetical protein
MAYPPVEKPKKEKKVKNFGTGYPGPKQTTLVDRAKIEQAD